MKTLMFKKLRVLALALCAGALQPVLAQTASAPSQTPNGAAGVALSAVDAEAWLDGLLPAALRTARVPGAVVVVVKDGQVLVQKGYGFADWEKNIAVDAQRTLFRPGSVSKLFTWVAVMQQVEAGKLDLDADLNQYLDFKIPAYKSGKALTLRHVMQHTSGFEETARDLLTYADKGPNLGGVLKAYVPPYVYEPGSTPGYSNYATALAGYIVERVSGLPFDDYIEQKVLHPIGMKQATFRQPLPEALKPQMSLGYHSQDKAGTGFEIISLPPAGSLSATGEDMGRFMLAMLNQGRLGDAQLLKPETLKQMFTQVYRPLPEVSGIGLGFYQKDINGHRAFGHGGDTVLFHTDLALFPEQNIGVYVSFNAGGERGMGKWLRDRVFEGFADRYLPDARAAAKPQVDEATAKAHAQLMAGAHRTTRREDSTFLSLLALLSPLKVEALKDGRIAVDLAGARSVFREISPFVWDEEHGKRRIQAQVENGKVTRWAMQPYAFAFVFEPVPALASPAALLLLCGAALVTALTALLWPLVAVLRRQHGVAAPASSVGWVRWACVGVLVALGLWTACVMALENLDDTTVLLPLAQIATLVAFGGGLLASAWHAKSVFQAGSAHSKWARLLALLWLLSFAVLLGLGLAHHMIGFNQWY
ncbi:serine hydrolase domain-containing protein [Roseateles violae]|uniref:Serine hydrolase domain-containing protein n=1 Tax=Roseateles violae TaxID=3058042 RepID=A0ABT8DQA7_9BURK|nr:serine hydrolase domain-containing protein [Pelomonas sp. PFR6]MDN3919129.1 serine hydrolase domain-containing protein [Pelomonas sp. PFR6]